jgi:DNA-binding response OmpR family regulator
MSGKKSGSTKNILIVENDLGFIFWLGGALVSSGYQPWPACSVSDATELIEKAALQIDLLIVDPSVPGLSKLIAILRRSQAELKLIALGAQVKTKLPGINAWIQKPGATQEPAKQEQEWLEAVKDVLIGHMCAA